MPEPRYPRENTANYAVLSTLVKHREVWLPAVMLCELAWPKAAFKRLRHPGRSAKHAVEDLRRLGWEIDSRIGRNGGYRLVGYRHQ